MGLVALCGPMPLCACVSEERGEGEGTHSNNIIHIVVFGFCYNRIKKGERQGKKCHAKTMMHSEAGEDYKNVRTVTSFAS